MPAVLSLLFIALFPSQRCSSSKIKYKVTFLTDGRERFLSKVNFRPSLKGSDKYELQGGRFEMFLLFVCVSFLYI